MHGTRTNRKLVECHGTSKYVPQHYLRFQELLAKSSLHIGHFIRPPCANEMHISRKITPNVLIQTHEEKRLGTNYPNIESYNANKQVIMACISYWSQRK